MDRLYAQFITRDDLVFDVGAHVGDRVASFRRLGARVVTCGKAVLIGRPRPGELLLALSELCFASGLLDFRAGDGDLLIVRAGEDSRQAIVVVHADWIVLMVVAPGTTYG